MYALHVPAAGEQPRLGELPVPEVTAGHVLVRVAAAGLNPIDTVIAAGLMTAMIPHEYPLVLGRDAAGVVVAIGAGVDHVAVGDEVFGHVPLVAPIRSGTLAEFALLPATAVALKPAGLDFATAAALPLAGAAADAAVQAVGPRPGDVVLVNGASGGVGSYAVQLLAARGATVVATGSGADADRLTGLGAALVVDHTRGPVDEQVLAAYPDGVHSLVNLAGNDNDEVPLAAVGKDGVVASTTMAPDADALAAAGLTGVTVLAEPDRETTGPLAEQVAAGLLTVGIDQVLPLDRAAEGLVTIAAGRARGKLVVLLGDGEATA